MVPGTIFGGAFIFSSVSNDFSEKKKRDLKLVVHCPFKGKVENKNSQLWKFGG